MNRAATIGLAPLSGLYGLIVDRREAFYHRGFFRQRRVAAPVISVGNVTVGGTGKTPLVDWIARELFAQGRNVCVVTRGYRRKSRGRVVVSNRREITARPDEAGDEAFMLAESLNTMAAVVCDVDRVEAARWAIENLKSDVIVLDDGFQHRRLARDLDIVVIDATNPWGNGLLLPAGTLREPISALSRADCFVITRENDANENRAFRSRLAQINEGAPIFTAVTNLTKMRELSTRTPRDLKEKVPAAFCAIGNPQAFFSLLKRVGFQLKLENAFRDHHRFSQSDIDSVQNAARNMGAEVLITTSKDGVKLRDLEFRMPCYVAEMAIEIEPADEFRKLLSRTIKSLKAS